MIRQTMRSLALLAAGLLLAGGAWGQVLRQTSSDSAMVAAEYFGGDPRLVQFSNMDLVPDDTNDPATEGQQRPYVSLNLSGADITDGNVAEITFVLYGATFDQPASATNLVHRLADCGGATNLTVVESSILSGGDRGDSTVTYRVEVTDTGSTDSIFDADPAQSICFLVPDLSVHLVDLSSLLPRTYAPGTMGVAARATAIRAVTSTGTYFPSRISGPQTADKDANGDGAFTGAEVGSAPNTDIVVMETANALNASLGNGGNALVNVADRTKIAKGGTPDPSSSNPTAATQGLSVGLLSVDTSGGNIFKLDGSGYLPNDRIDGSLSGQITLTVGGPYQSGDRVVVGSGATALTAEIDGMAATVTVQTAIIEGMPIVYVPGGVDALKPSTFAAGAAYLFNDRRNNNAMITWTTAVSSVLPHSPLLSSAGAARRSMSYGTIAYEGVALEGYAYGVVRGGGSDQSFVRVTCEASVECKVFLDCTGQDGEDYFSDAPPVAAGETVAWSSQAIADVLGSGDNWTAGRGRCDIHSTGQLSVQHMVRSGTTLVNSSAVVGRGLDESRDVTLASIERVVYNICTSIEGHAGRIGHLGDLNNPATDDNDPSNDRRAIAPTPCANWNRAAVPQNVDTNGPSVPGF